LPLAEPVRGPPVFQRIGKLGSGYAHVHQRIAAIADLPQDGNLSKVMRQVMAVQPVEKRAVSSTNSGGSFCVRESVPLPPLGKQ